MERVTSSLGCLRVKLLGVYCGERQRTSANLLEICPSSIVDYSLT